MLDNTVCKQNSIRIREGTSVDNLKKTIEKAYQHKDEIEEMKKMKMQFNRSKELGADAG
jgi:hypothetical protein